MPGLVPGRNAQARQGHRRRSALPVLYKATSEIAARAEVLRLRDQAQAARALVNDLRERYPRHRAFQAERDTPLGISQRRG